MAVYHIVLFKLKPSVTAKDTEELKQTLTGLVGKIPGLIRMDVGPPHVTQRAQGYNMGLVAILESPETIKIYAEHPEHLKVHKLRESLCDDTLAYDLDYTQ